MQVQPEVETSDVIDGSAYIKQKQDYEEKFDTFMRKYLHRAWPKRIVTLLGILQLFLSLAILGIDLPIILMFAPRWQVFAGCWTFIFGLITCVSTIHSTRKTTWLKLKWTVALNVVGGVAAGVMVAFDILYLINPYMCVAIGGCNYLSYTYSAAKPFYTSQLVLGIFLILTAFLFIVIFFKYGIGGATLFDDIQEGRAPVIHKPMVQTNGIPMGNNPVVGAGVMNMLPPGPMMVPGPRGPMMVPGPMMMPPPRGPMMPSGPMMMPPPRGSMMPPGPMMMPPPRGPMMPPGPMMMPRPRGPMMPPGPMMIRAPMMPAPRGSIVVSGPRGPMVVPDPRGHMSGYYEQQPAHPPHY